MKGLLFAKYLDGSLSKEEAAELKAYLSTGDAARREFAAFCEDEVSLFNVLMQRSHAEPTAADRGVLRLPWRAARWSVAAAATVALAVGLGWWLAPDAERMQATQPGVADAATNGAASLAEAWPLVTGGDGALKQAPNLLDVGETAESTLRYADGTRITCRGGTSLRIDDNAASNGIKHLTLLAGALFAETSRQLEDRPLRITTPHAELAVLGTKFSLTVTPSQPSYTRLSVVQGLVRLTYNGESHDVGAGQATAAGPTVTPKVTVSEGREYSPRFGGVFFRDIMSIYESNRSKANRGDPDLFALDRLGPDASLRRVTAELPPRAHNKGGLDASELIPPAPPHGTGVWEWTSGELPSGEYNRWTAVLFPEGPLQLSLNKAVKSPQNRRYPAYFSPPPMLDFTGTWVTFTYELLKVGNQPDGTPLWEFCILLDGIPISRGWERDPPSACRFTLAGRAVYCRDLVFECGAAAPRKQPHASK